MSGDMDLHVSMKEADDVEELDMDDLDATIKTTREEIEQNPYDILLHEKLINLLRKNGDLQELHEARNQMSKLFPLSSKMWIEWIQDERFAETDASNIEQLFERAVFDSNSLDVWVEYVQWACGVNVSTARTVFELAISAIGLRVDIGGLLWESFLDFEEAILAGVDEANKEKQHTIVVSLYRRALRVPHVDLSGTWERYLAFAQENIDEGIRAVYESSVNTMKELAMYEMKLTETNDSLDTLYEYLQFEIEKDDPCRIQSFYERIVDKYAQDENVWLGYGKWCESILKIHTVTSRVYERAIRHCSYSCALWQQTLLALERADVDAKRIDSLWSSARETITTADYGRALYRTYLYLLRRRAISTDNNFKQMAEVFEEGAKSLLEWFAGEWDSQGEYRRNWAWFAFTKLGDISKGRKIWEDILASGGGRLAERWLEAVRLERQFGDVQIARKLLYKALNSVSDHPNMIFEYIIQFEREEGTLEELDKALEKVNAQAVHRANRPHKQKDDAGKGKVQREEQKPRSTEKVMDRKRPGMESLNAPAAKKTPTFPDHNLPNQPSLPSPSKDKDGFAMPMLPVKRKSSAPTSSLSDTSTEPGQSKEESREAKKFTVFVSNLDFKVTSDKIKQVLSGVIDVRLIYRGMSKLHKGYGYVDFDNADDMRDALAKDRVPIDGRPMLISENNPEKRVGFKYKTGLEKTKIFVRNVHYDCSEDQLKQLFSEFGPIEDVRIVTHKSGKSKGCAYIDFRTEEAAKSALDAPEIVLLDRKLNVAMSNPPKKNDVSTLIHDTPTNDERRSRSSMIQLIPRVVKKSSPMSNGSGATKSVPMRMSNDQFRQFLNNK